MKNRRDFLKTIAVGAGSLTLSQTAIAQVTKTAKTLPAIISLLLDDDSETVQCADVACSRFFVGMDYSNIDNNNNSIFLEVETPGGTRLVAAGQSTMAEGQCNSWELGGTDGANQGVRSVTLSGTSINPGRYQLFGRLLTANNSNFISVSVDACGLRTGNNVSNINFPANNSVLLGSINISSGGSPTVNIFGNLSPPLL